MGYLDKNGKWVEKFPETAKLRMGTVGDIIMNEFTFEGVLLELKKFSEKVGSVKIKVAETIQGKQVDNNFFVTAFLPELTRLDQVAPGSIIRIKGRHKNSVYEKDGKQVFKPELIMNSLQVIRAAVKQPDLGDSQIPF